MSATGLPNLIAALRGAPVELPVLPAAVVVPALVDAGPVLELDFVFLLDSVGLLSLVLRFRAVPVPAALTPVPVTVAPVPITATPVPKGTVVVAMVEFVSAVVVVVLLPSEGRGVSSVTVVEAEDDDDEEDSERGKAVVLAAVEPPERVNMPE